MTYPRALGAAVFGSAMLHGLLFAGVSQSALRAPPAKPRTLEFDVVEPPPPEPIPEEEMPLPEVAPPAQIDLQDIEIPTEIPPPSDTNEDTPAEEVVPTFGISMTSTSSGDGGASMTVRVGNTLMKDPEKDFTPPAEVRAYATTPISKVSKMPREKNGECPADYPPKAQRDGIEGVVRLSVEVLADGSVGQVRRLSTLGHGLDEAAVSALKRCKFFPAEVDGTPVSTRIQYNVRFEQF